MKYYNQKELTIRYLGKKILTATYKGIQLLWQSVRSCFGSGRWKSDKPWKSNERWRNG